MRIERTNNRTYEYVDYDSFTRTGWTRDMVDILLDCMEDQKFGINFIDRVKKSYLEVIFVSAVPLLIVYFSIYAVIFGSFETVIDLENNQWGENPTLNLDVGKGFFLFWLFSFLLYPFTYLGYKRLIVVYFLRPDLCRYFLFFFVTLTSIISAPIINCIMNKTVYDKYSFEGFHQKPEDEELV